MGRRPLGIDLVERMVGPPQAKDRLMAVLESLSGEGTVAELAQICGVGRSRFYELRERALYGALSALLPERPGPRPQVADARDEEIAELEAQLEELRVQLVAERVRTELALVMPHVLREPSGGPKPRATGRGTARGPNGATTRGSKG